MQIWVDADACPQVIKEILFRAAERAQVVTTLVANTPLRTPPSSFVRTVRVAPGFDVADHWIVQRVQPGDLVVTADIPLAAEGHRAGRARPRPARRAVLRGQRPRTPRRSQSDAGAAGDR